jgi:site-specific recombinase XerD
MNLQLLIEQYITHRRSLGESQGSNGRALRAFGRAIGAGADIADVRGEQVDAFLVGTGPITLNWHIKHGTLRAFYHYAVSRGYVAAAPLPAVIPKRPPPFAPYIFSREDLRRLFQAADSDPHRHVCLEPVTMRTTLLLLYGAGLRVREAVDLNRADVDLDAPISRIQGGGSCKCIPDLCNATVRWSTMASQAAFSRRLDNDIKINTFL